MDLIAYLALLRRSWLALLLCFALGGALGYGASYRTAPQYRATASVFLSPGQGQSIGELAQGSSYTRSLVQSYVRLAVTPTVLQPVVDQLGLDTTADALADQVTAQAQQDTVLIDITAVAGSAESAAAIANAVGDQLADATESLSPVEPGEATTIDVTTVAPATAPRAPFSPDRRLDAGIGAVLGALLVVGVVVGRELLDTRVRDRDDVLEVTDVPVLAVLPAPGRGRRPGRRRGRGDRAEAVRRLRATVRSLAGDGSHRFLVVPAADGGRGAGLALELARALADHETRVLLVEADLRSPALARTLGLGPGPGLADVLLDAVPAGAAVRRVETPGPSVLPAGTARHDLSPGADELVGSAALQRVLDELQASFDLVLLTAPPVLAAADAAALATGVDGVAVVAQVPATTRRQLADALRDLELVRARVVGVVLDHAGGRGRADRGARPQEVDVGGGPRGGGAGGRPPAAPPGGGGPGAAP
ncbi:Wzz/FepE/Etk N-terminal domain-containing protein, partial [Kineococcus sp. SYSU DK002]|uniref:Wzz/FepE/Etk N-terminal domain-containing protein n=1 Tax=Kineococcus sp. SYSU DK002 TaxID=3383123 RepID=UPI003D7E545C